MEKHIPYAKLSKAKRRELDLARRKNWGGISPVTRKPENPKAYNRKRFGKTDGIPQAEAFYFFRY